MLISTEKENCVEFSVRYSILVCMKLRIVCAAAAGCILLLAGCGQDSVEVFPLQQWEYAASPTELSLEQVDELAFEPLPPEQQRSLERLIPGGDGYIWLRTGFSRPPARLTAGQDLLGLFLGRITMADITYLNGVAIGQTGRFPPEFFSEWNTFRHYTFAPELLQEQNTLLIQIYVGHEGAIVGDAYIGQTTTTGFYWRLNTFVGSYLNMGISLVMLVIGLYHLWLFLKRPQERENMYFALLNIAGAIYLVNFFVTLLPGWEFWTISFTLFQRIVANAMIYVIVFASAFFVRSFLQRREPMVLQILVVLLSAVPVVMSFVLPDYQALRSMRPVMLSFALPILVYILYMLAASAVHRRRDSLVLLLGISPLLATAVADIIIHNYLHMYHMPYIGGFGFPLMILSLLFILAGRFAEARSQAEDLNINLEQKVEQRTEELQNTNRALEDTLSQLQAAQAIAAKDMQMAVRVQQSFYPSASPQLPPWQTGLVFQPASGVAGDLYDFFLEDDSLKGISLFDVSGHGISSGLVAMLAKSIIARSFQAGAGQKLPRILQNINTELIQEKGEIENYMTGVLLRLRDTTVEFVNAGHTELLLREARNSKLHRVSGGGAQGSIVGVPDLPTSYPALRFTMAPGDLLLMYSDALIESVNPQGQQYGLDGVMHTLALAGGLSAQDVADRLEADLRRFVAHDQPLKDDLTIITLRRMSQDFW